jgi:pimeloyl-ACP methyl ester carboxylesterase
VRALEPNLADRVERNGVGVHYEIFGEGDPTVLLLPTWTLQHSRIWKAQVPYLARHFRVVTFDPRGNGLSDRPGRPEDYSEREFAADAIAVLDAAEAESAVIVSLSQGAQRALLLGADHPERVVGAVFIGPFFPASMSPGSFRWRLMASRLLFPLIDKRPLTQRGWGRFNGWCMRNDYHAFVDWFIRLCFPEPHSTKQIEDGIAWAGETDGQTLSIAS